MEELITSDISKQCLLSLKAVSMDEALSRISILYSDALEHPSFSDHASHTEISNNCSVGFPFFILQKTATPDIFTLPEMKQRSLKMTGYLTLAGKWIPGNQIAKEGDLAERLMSRWKTANASSAPLELTIAGKMRTFDSYHYADPQNLQLSKRVSHNDCYNFIEIGYKDIQACRR